MIFMIKIKMLDIGKPGSGDWSQIADKRGQAKLEQGSANKQTNTGQSGTMLFCRCLQRFESRRLARWEPSNIIFSRFWTFFPSDHSFLLWQPDPGKDAEGQVRWVRVHIQVPSIQPSHQKSKQILQQFKHHTSNNQSKYCNYFCFQERGLLSWSYVLLCLTNLWACKTNGYKLFSTCNFNSANQQFFQKRGKDKKFDKS